MAVQSNIQGEEKQKTNWHALSSDEVLQTLNVSAEGLSSREAQARLSHYGKNALEKQEGPSAVRLLVKQINSPIIYLLLGAAGLSFVTGHNIDGAVILAVVVLNSLLGFIQEWRAQRALESLHKISAPHAKVLRDGEIDTVPAQEIVPGDILVIETGDRVAADARLLEEQDLQVDESALTGESEPADKDPANVDPDAPIADRRNMVWMSSPVRAGRGRAVVVATGMETALGDIAGQVHQAEEQQTPLQRQMAKLGRILGIAGVSLAVFVFGLGLLMGYGLEEMMLYGIAVAVSSVPYGLPAVVSITLALAVQRMAKEHAIVRELPAVETLGSTTVICSDKTGTITRNQMTVARIWAGGKTYEVTGEGYNPEGSICPESGGEMQEGKNPAFDALMALGALANNAAIQEEEGEWHLEGTPTEGAILVASRKAGIDPEKLQEEQPRQDEIPFSSEDKYMAVLHNRQDGKDFVVYVKGAPEKMLNFCSHLMEDGEIVELDDDRRKKLQEVNDTFARMALRVVAGACRDVGQDFQLEPENVKQNLVLAGMWGMADPPRPAAIAAVKQAKDAGIHIVLITGDHATTAAAIAKRVGITEEEDAAVTGPELEKMSPQEVADHALTKGVFARVSPAHKLKILEALKERDQIVAMTGDGVNDAPALQGAHIGVAMGRSGTEVAKEAADMVLTDDDFATIVHAVEEGRTIFANLRRVVFFLISANAGEVITLIGALLIGVELPLTAIMILWINLVSDGISTVPLGVEPRHSDVLNQPPRAPGEGMLNGKIIRRILLLTPFMAAGTLGLFLYDMRSSNYAFAQTRAFTTLVAFQWFHLLNARSFHLSVFRVGLFSNRWLAISLGIAVLLQLGAVYTGVGQLVFGTVPLSALDWLACIALASSIFIADEILKALGVHGKPPKQTQAS